MHMGHICATVSIVWLNKGGFTQLCRQNTECWGKRWLRDCPRDDSTYPCLVWVPVYPVPGSEIVGFAKLRLKREHEDKTVENRGEEGLPLFFPPSPFAAPVYYACVTPSYLRGWNSLASTSDTALLSRLIYRQKRNSGFLKDTWISTD